MTKQKTEGGTVYAYKDNGRTDWGKNKHGNAQYPVPMARALGYMGDFHEDAYEYKKEADEGMKEDAEETREIAREQREESIRNRKEEREEQEKKLEEERKENKGDKIVDTVEISEDGKVLLKENTEVESADMDTDAAAPLKPKADLEPVFYSSAGKVEEAQPEASVSVSV